VRWSPYYIRRVRVNSSDPLLKLMRDQGAPMEPEVGQTPEDATTWVIGFPVKSPAGATTRHDVGALEQLEFWKRVKVCYTEHQPSCTVYVREDEWPAVQAWVYTNWNIVGGLSFLPSTDSIYPLAPYEEIDAATYERLLAAFPKVDYSKLSQYEHDDNTTGARELACSSGTCEI
jgi:ribonucleoside-diphosphate reductase alpha chain